MYYPYSCIGSTAYNTGRLNSHNSCLSTAVSVAAAASTVTVARTTEATVRSARHGH